MRPEPLACRRVDRVRTQVRRRVKDAVVDDRARRERAELAKLEHAYRPQLSGVGRVDAIERRVTLGTIALVVHHPVRRRTVGSIELRLRGLRGRRLRELAVEGADLHLRRTGACHRTARDRAAEVEHTLHRRSRGEFLVARRNAALREKEGNDIRIDLPVERSAFSQRHVVVHVAVELLQRLAAPLHDEGRPLERRRSAALGLRAVTHRAFLRVLVAALADLGRAEERRAVGECG